MSEEIVSSDVALLDLMRKRDGMSVTELAECMQVTATAVRQRLTRLMAQGYIGRASTKSGRGRPSHLYSLTSQGRRKTGENFADLAIALWQEIRDVKDAEVRRGLFTRIARRMADLYADQVKGETATEKMESIAEIFGRRQIPISIETEGEMPILSILACPYPDLAEQDRAVCSMERAMFSELLGQEVRLSSCRLDGDNCCTFEPRHE